MCLMGSSFCLSGLPPLHFILLVKFYFSCNHFYDDFFSSVFTIVTFLGLKDLLKRYSLPFLILVSHFRHIFIVDHNCSLTSFCLFARFFTSALSFSFSFPTAFILFFRDSRSLLGYCILPLVIGLHLPHSMPFLQWLLLIINNSPISSPLFFI